MHCVAALAMLSVATIDAAVAQGNYPSRPIRVVVPFAPGGAADVIARPILAKLKDRLGQPLVIENKGGASGLIGVAEVAKAAPNGYTILLAHVSNMTIVPLMEPGLAYNSPTYFEPVTTLVSGPMIAVVRPDSPFKTLSDLVAYGKANPEKLIHGSAGIGGTTHLAGVLLSRASGIKMLHVPHNGIAPVLTEIIGGRVDIAFAGASGVMSFITAGRLRALAVFEQDRTAMLPNVPTAAETYPGVVVNSWYGFMAPKGTPREIVQRLQRESAEVLKMPDIVAFVQKTALDAIGNTPEQMDKLIKQDLALWDDVLKAEGMVKPAAGK